MIAWTMPDALELLTTRRSFKAVELAGPPPSAAEIDTLLTVASRVPDHGKLAPWRFIVFEGEARRSAGEAIAAAFRAKYRTRSLNISRPSASVSCARHS
jgi:nitroreductase